MKRFFYAALVLFGIAMIVFLMFNAFGDPVHLIAGQTGDRKTMDNIRSDLYFDQPKWKQFLYYLNDVSPLSFYNKEAIHRKNLHGLFIGRRTKFVLKFPYLGRSYQTKKNVSSILLDALPGTLVLAIAAMLLACVTGISLGIVSALNQNSWADRVITMITISGISAPSFFIAIIIAYVFAVVLHPYTGFTLTGSLIETDEITGEKYLNLKNLILPAITLGVRPLAIITQLTRSAMLDVLAQDYIRTAYAKGLKKIRIVLKHALRNALNPVITAITGWFAELLAGAFFVEYIFGWKGIGKITVDALEKLDYPVVAGALLFSAAIFVCINLLADFFYKITDPRINP